MSSITSTIIAKAKAHHASVNAAYNTYYSAGTTPTTSPSPSRNTSQRPSMESSRTTSTSSSSSTVSKAWSTIKKAAREHHQSVNAAYASYYGAGASPVVTDAYAPLSGGVEEKQEMLEREIMEREVRLSGEFDAETETKEEKKLRKAWEQVKQAVREHHRGVNQAYAVYYGQGHI